MKSMSENISRRDFIKRAAIGAAGIAGFANSALANTKNLVKRSALDRVVLGRSGIKISRLGMGTGTNGGRIQRELGQKAFTELVRYGIERGITFFDTADNYRDLHEMLRTSLKGVDREKIQIQTKIPYGRYQDPLKELDRFRREIGTDYFDSLLMHHVQESDWPEQQQRLMDTLDLAKEREIVRSHGVSIHGLDPLRAAPDVSWIDIAFVRVNHTGHHMDGTTGRWAEPGIIEPALSEIKKIHENGAGVIGMKLIGNGDYKKPEEREASINFVTGLDYVDAVVIGFKSTQEIDEAIQLIDTASNS